MQAPDNFNPPAGQSITLEPGLQRILAPNPSPMTYRGTNTYLVGKQDIAVVDPGPEDERHLDAILAALLPGQRVSHIIVTHTHVDHAPLARPLSEKTGAPVYAFGGAEAGRSDVMKTLSASGLIGGGEGIDTRFAPDITVTDGSRIEGTDWALDVLHTPGHLGNHICLGLGDVCLTADHVMGWASSLVSPPDGDLTDFMASCRRLAARDWRVFYPGHGAPIEDPAGRLAWLIGHRESREAAILGVLRQQPATAGQITAEVYEDTPAPLLPAATRNVLAHLIDLTGRGKAEPRGLLSADAVFEYRQRAD